MHRTAGTTLMRKEITFSFLPGAYFLTRYAVLVSKPYSYLSIGLPCCPAIRIFSGVKIAKSKGNMQSKGNTREADCKAMVEKYEMFS